MLTRILRPKSPKLLPFSNGSSLYRFCTGLTWLFQNLKLTQMNWKIFGSGSWPFGEEEQFWQGWWCCGLSLIFIFTWIFIFIADLHIHRWSVLGLVVVWYIYIYIYIFFFSCRGLRLSHKGCCWWSGGGGGCGWLKGFVGGCSWLTVAVDCAIDQLAVVVDCAMGCIILL